MPPQQTDPGFESDAAVLDLDLTTALVTEVKDDAWSEKNAARPTAVSTRTFLRLLERTWRAFGEWRQRQRSRTTLHDLSDRELKDIGVTRDEIDYIAPHRAIDALRDSIHSRGVM
ncbi:DUF1127 domain-containing protein [Afipia sp. GAS231]|uniref:DUF1127 domain-containing protein n=1 Tax=Afipia sp. GAS231 TaxID=1882747 RepID=UPI00087C249E|nr:DUF1127 domain-containing protein [Afipia sp. GAS231]SDN05194.1 Uncharacterized conserved protein YjiS, DUF1127 family [Afipia sp. GAS231]